MHYQQKTPARAEAVFDRREAAAYLKIGRGTLAKLDIPRFNIGRRVLYKKAAIDQWIEAQAAGGNKCTIR